MNTPAVMQYFAELNDVIIQSKVTRADGSAVSLPEAVDEVINLCRSAHNNNNEVFFIGNGGCAGICSHMAIDFSKNGNIRAQALNDSSALTCLGNDFGFEFVFSKQIEFHARPGDVLIALSASGNSANILNGVESAKQIGCEVITFSGFKPDNPLRTLASLNFYINSMEYGFVETGYQALLHCILDVSAGWQAGR